MQWLQLLTDTCRCDYSYWLILAGVITDIDRYLQVWLQFDWYLQVWLQFDWYLQVSLQFLTYTSRCDYSYWSILSGVRNNKYRVHVEEPLARFHERKYNIQLCFHVAKFPGEFFLKTIVSRLLSTTLFKVYCTLKKLSWLNIVFVVPKLKKIKSDTAGLDIYGKFYSL